MKIVIYESNDPLRENERCIAWLTEDRAVVDKDGKRTGEVKTVFLPVYFFGSGRDVAEGRALAFWKDERSKAAAKTKRGRKLGLFRAKVLA